MPDLLAVGNTPPLEKSELPVNQRVVVVELSRERLLKNSISFA